MNNDITNITRLTPAAHSDSANSRISPIGDKVALPLDTTKTATVSYLPLTSQSKADKEKSPEMSAAALKSAVNQGNALFQTEKRNLQFQVDNSTKQVVVKVIDQATGDVIRQIPTKEVLSFLKKMQDQEGSNGLFIKDHA